jgi:endonuclease G
VGYARYAGDFFPDPELDRGARAEPNDYQGLWKKDRSGYDRGHQAPDATLRVFGLEAQQETYSLANVTPQHSQINQSIWADVEAWIRRWSSVSEPVWVVTGPVFLPRRDTLWVGRDRVAVPHAYFAVLNRGPGPDVLCFLIANQTEAPWYSSLQRFLVSVDSVERLTGLDFLAELPDSVENRLESARPNRLWP